MIIIGAGMAGLLAGGMIRDRQVTIYEAAPTLPNNHSAVLRFRSSVVGDTLGIEFKEVKMLKVVHPWMNGVADNLAYAMKCTGTATLRSLVSAEGGIQKRFIAPSNLIELMVQRINGDFELGIGAILETFQGDPCISTIPMPALMDILGYKHKPEFRYVHGYNINAEISGVEAYASVYIPDPEFPYNRISLTGNRLTIETSLPDTTPEAFEDLFIEADANQEFIIQSALYHLGLSGQDYKNIELKKQRYSKILPIDEQERKRFILWASEKFNIYSLGRFATWRPGLLLDDLVHDVRVIQRLINGTLNPYDHVKR